MNTEFDLDALVRPNIRELKPYRSARDDYGEGLLLDANENALGPPAPSLAGLHRYPPPRHPGLRRRMADWRGVEPANVFLGVGSDEAIDLLMRIFCEPGRGRILIAPPTYGMYRVSARIHNAAVDEVVTDREFQPRPEALRKATGPETRLLFLCSPNNPTGNLVEPGRLENILDWFPGIVVVDEAYIDFSNSPSLAPKVREHPNLVVLQTFSKSFGLAGARFGYAFGPEPVIDYLMKVKPPYNVSSLTASAAAEALDHLETMKSNADAIRGEREKLASRLAELDTVRRVFDSQANFLLVRVTEARRIYRELAEAGVIVRYRGDEPLCEECLRITVGSPGDNERLIEALKKRSP